jgi:2-keto-3-deoxy-6-phosphogluconate aldolase
MQKNNYLAKGMAFGIAIGTAIGIATDNTGVWMCVGLALGAGVGSSLMKKHKKDQDNKTN